MLKPRTVQIGEEPLLLDSPRVDNGDVYIGDGHGTGLVKVCGSTLDVLWRVPLRTEARVVTAMGGAVVVAASDARCSGYATDDGRYMWGVANDFEGCIPWSGKLVAPGPLGIIDPGSGAIARTLWHSSDLVGAPSLREDVILGRRRGTGILSAFDLREERRLWSADLVPALTEALGRSPEAVEYVGSERTLASTRDRIVVADPGGQIVWSRDVALESQPTIGPTSVFILAAGRGQPARFRSLDLSTGETVFETAPVGVSALERPFRGTVDGSHVAFGTNRGLVVSFDAHSGQMEWSYRHSSATKSPVFGLRWAFCSTADGCLLAFDAGESAS
jgi:outer membrane protein assembly factor BamB